MSTSLPSASAGDREHRVQVDLDGDGAMAALATVVDDWGGQWEREGTSARLVLPIRSGLRVGLMAGRVWTEPSDEGVEIVLREEKRDDRVQWPAVICLALGLAGGLVTIVAPMFPVLVPLIPVALILAFASWLLIVTQLKNSGVEELFEQLVLVSQVEPLE
ncbi:MAG: hypothetical protein AAGD38_11310 [Acidobacteriota bacterium]